MTSITASSLLQMRAQILQQNAALQKAAGAAPSAPVAPAGGAAAPSGPGAADFGDALKSALGQVNQLQTKSDAMSASYERGDTTDVAAVMLAREQASVGFQATLQVRNKLLSAYKDIMSMPV
ncbi:flagellar hook-basal body complex protein FliE [Sphingomonas morindae]|uniref:Flagellar hook-basal body complex protein FliE n=1 Tax=Sphingomonas morindae TaxID=1541170 RepID=A0ABY4XA36_9SPHN|nr:flagellar hook-basal body complex protein FliE [Sphingomonas morindae]USI73725.1 flagellar hook-basal body complex protein FliE [Sphingomonas morindae]